MEKTILFVVGPALGHVGRSLSIATALFSIGQFNVLFAGVKQGYGEDIISRVFPFHTLSNEDDGGVCFADELELLVNSAHPDLICLDLTPIPWLTQFRFPDIPTVYLTNYFLTKQCLSTTFQELQFRDLGQRLNAVRESRGLAPIQDIKQVYDKDLVICCDPSSLVLPAKTLPSNYHVVGPCLWEPEMELPDKLEKMNDFLFISFGSTGRRPIPHSFVEGIAAGLDTKNIVWLGNRHLHEKVRQGAFVHHYYSWLPSSQVLSRSKFVITQGGAGSTYQAISHGCPTGVWSNHLNQKLMGLLIQDFGCGALLDEVLDPAAFIADCFSPMQSYSRNMARNLEGVDGPGNAAELVMELLN